MLYFVNRGIHKYIIAQFSAFVVGKNRDRLLSRICRRRERYL
jgi:hypothetical protein